MQREREAVANKMCKSKHTRFEGLLASLFLSGTVESFLHPLILQISSIEPSFPFMFVHAGTKAQWLRQYRDLNKVRKVFAKLKRPREISKGGSLFYQCCPVVQCCLQTLRRLFQKYIQHHATEPVTTVSVQFLFL